jgi:hypothetical protein
MRQSDRYNPPWERYTRADYIEIKEFVKRKLTRGFSNKSDNRRKPGVTSAGCTENGLNSESFLRLSFFHPYFS